MKGLAICFEGMEDICAKEISSLIETSPEVGKGAVIFDIEYKEDLCLLSYASRSVNRFLYLLDSFSVIDYDDFKRVKDIDFKEFVHGRTFAVKSVVVHNILSSQEISSSVGQYIDGNVDLKNPQVTVISYIYDSTCYIGIDFSGEISKRPYKHFTSRNDIKGTIANGLISIMGYTGKDVLLDPFLI